MGSLDGIFEGGPQFANLLLKPAAPGRWRRVLLVGLAAAACHIYLLALHANRGGRVVSAREEIALQEIDDISILNLDRIDWNAPDGPPVIIPPPPGFGGNTGSGGGIDIAAWQGSSDPAVNRALRWLTVHSGEGNGSSMASGLDWLVRHQAASGRWGINDFPRYVGCNCSGCGLDRDSTAATALALLPFLATGETHKQTGRNSRHQPVVNRGLRHLLQQQREDGRFGGAFAHALTTWAVCEAYGLSGDPALKGPAFRAVNAIITAQHSQGGWACATDEPLDLELTGWNVLALKSAVMAGLNVPNATWAGITQYLDAIATADGSFYGSRTLTPIALHCRMLTGWGRRSPALARGIERLTEEAPAARPQSIVTTYHVHQVVHFFGNAHGGREDRWDEQVRELLAEEQDQGSIRCQKGSWPPAQDWTGKKLGRLGTTALALLVLETDHRHQPSYRYWNRREMGAMKDEAIRDAVK